MSNGQDHKSEKFCSCVFDVADLIREYGFSDVLPKAGGITLRQQVVLSTVMKKTKLDPDGITLKELSETIRLTPGTVSGLVDTLVRKNALSRRQHPVDRRSILITLSDDMTKYLTGVGKKMSDFAEKAAEGLSENEKEVLSSALEKILNKLNIMKENQK